MSMPKDIKQIKMFKQYCKNHGKEKVNMFKVT